MPPSPTAISLCAASIGRREKGIPTAPWETIFNDPRTFASDMRAYLNLEHTYKYSDYLSVSSSLSHDWYRYRGDYALDYGDEEEPNFVLNIDDDIGQWWSGNIHLEGQLQKKHRIVAGAQYRYNTRQDQRNYDEEVYLDDRRTSRIVAVHLQHEYAMRNDVIVNVGLRYDNYESFGGTTSPRLALIYDPLKRTTLKLLYGTAFRAPNAYEMYFHDGFEGEYSTQKPNLDLKPEYIETYEIVLEQALRKELRAALSFYSYSVSDLITLQTDPNDELLVFQNHEQAEAQGLEFELRGRFRQTLQGRMSYAYQTSEAGSEGETLPNSPGHLAKASLVAPILRRVLTAGFEVQHTRDRKTLSGADVDPVTLANFTFVGRPWNDDIELSVSVHNVFDETYANPASEEHVQDLIQQDGRTYRLKLRYRF